LNVDCGVRIATDEVVRLVRELHANDQIRKSDQG
uniref:Succinyl-CoA--3-ketoacid-CoA transferase n=1 Tax=Echinostoma caproni TaxID=27848 RepID=A0A183B7G5_9TREM